MIHRLNILYCNSQSKAVSRCDIVVAKCRHLNLFWFGVKYQFASLNRLIVLCELVYILIDRQTSVLADLFADLLIDLIVDRSSDRLADR